MKQFLRYQISGMVFIFWILIFYYSGISKNLDEFIKNFSDGMFFKKEFVYAFITAMPFGVIIHQVSVSIKNHIVAKMCKELDDFPQKKYLSNLIKNQKRYSKQEIDKIEYTKYILDKISNLNSFYYVRFDNGFLAPFLAFVIVIASGYRVNSNVVAISITVGFIMLYYIKRICKELKYYRKLL